MSDLLRGSATSVKQNLLLACVTFNSRVSLSLTPNEDHPTSRNSIFPMHTPRFTALPPCLLGDRTHSCTLPNRARNQSRIQPKNNWVALAATTEQRSVSRPPDPTGRDRTLSTDNHLPTPHERHLHTITARAHFHLSRELKANTDQNYPSPLIHSQESVPRRSLI